MAKDNSITSAGAGDDSQQKAEVTSESQHSIKPIVVGLPSSTDDYQKRFDEKVNDVLAVLECLTTQKAKAVLESAIYRLPAHSCVQSPQALRLVQPN